MKIIGTLDEIMKIKGALEAPRYIVILGLLFLAFFVLFLIIKTLDIKKPILFCLYYFTIIAIIFIIIICLCSIFHWFGFGYEYYVCGEGTSVDVPVGV